MELGHGCLGGRLAITVDGEPFDVEFKQEDRFTTGTSASSAPDLIELEEIWRSQDMDRAVGI